MCKKVRADDGASVAPWKRACVWMAGVVGLVVVILIQWPMLRWSWEQGFRMDSGKAAFQTTWNVITLVVDVVVLVWWTVRRPLKFQFAFLVPVGLLIVWGVLIPVAFVVAMLLPRW